MMYFLLTMAYKIMITMVMKKHKTKLN